MEHFQGIVALSSNSEQCFTGDITFPKDMEFETIVPV